MHFADNVEQMLFVNECLDYSMDMFSRFSVLYCLV